MIVGTEMAIIGFWSQEEQEEQDGTLFKCYSYFYLPKPITRSVRKSDRKLESGKKSTLTFE